MGGNKKKERKKERKERLNDTCELIQCENTDCFSSYVSIR